jgi:hypothetical protein
MEDTKECKDKDNKPELQHLHLLAFGTDLAIYLCLTTSLCRLGSYKYAEFDSIVQFTFLLPHQTKFVSKPTTGLRCLYYSVVM